MGSSLTRRMALMEARWSREKRVVGECRQHEEVIEERYFDPIDIIRKGGRKEEQGRGEKEKEKEAAK